jgi:peptide/nickel transport system substrate-binding protein
MPRRLWLSFAVLALGAALLVVAGLAAAARDAGSLRQGGIFRHGMTGASVQIDPQISYATTAWWLEYATAAKLYDYPDRPGAAGNRLVPEVASGFRISTDGRTYTLFVRKAFRFSDGSRVTPWSFRYAIDRVANRKLASPGAQFITDPNGTEIVGARRVNEGRAQHVRGVVVRGNRLIIRLARPDGSFLSKLAMPFFQATSSRLPLTREIVRVDSVDDLPTAGPYAFALHDPERRTAIRRNPYWTPGPGRARPRHLSGLDMIWNLNEQTAFEQVQANELDAGPVPAADAEGVAAQYGVNRTRFWTEPILCTGYLAFNTHRRLFRSVALRKAVNWAVDRTAYLAQAGPYAGIPWTHLLTPGFPGAITAKRLQPYSVRPNLAKALRLVGAHLGSRKIRIAYRSSGTINPAQAQLVRRDLMRLGFRPSNITMHGFSGADIYAAMGKRSSNLDLGVSLGWCSDAADPHDILALFVDPANPVAVESREYRRKLAAAARLVGNARFRAFGRLDLELMRNVAPIAVMRTYNSRYLFSNRVDPRSLSYQAVYSGFSIPALALK